MYKLILRRKAFLFFAFSPPPLPNSCVCLHLAQSSQYSLSLRQDTGLLLWLCLHGGASPHPLMSGHGTRSLLLSCVGEIWSWLSLSLLPAHHSGLQSPFYCFVNVFPLSLTDDYLVGEPSIYLCVWSRGLCQGAMFWSLLNCKSSVFQRKECEKF